MLKPVRRAIFSMLLACFALAAGCTDSHPPSQTSESVERVAEQFQAQLSNTTQTEGVKVFKDHDAALQAANAYYQTLFTGNKDMPAELTSSNWMTVKEAVANDDSGVDIAQLRQFFDIWANDAAPAWYRNPWIIGPLVALIGVALAVMVVVGKRKRAQ